ncbi:non-ribosomal peptide synthetase [Dyella tabacisoli]|uniref:Amino acid adenylation domain-containing protein n=1 Tax=Dyella tabacisoli TaxID=2282381 RepID=A0A369UI37_9GAMM|nr:non-ribosomal peptide synthetase [Dyella tabacisoli]RDD80414.1 amino acid adenylation domain-containing protein [Dyella tabacisoli]
MNVMDLLRDMDEQGVRISVVDDDLVLRYEGPRLSPELRELVRFHKPAILAQLRALQGSGAAPRLTRQSRPAVLPLSFAQERLWFLDRLGLSGPAYSVPVAFSLSGTLDVPALEHSFAELVRRHESLRTRFESQAGSAVQVIDPAGGFHLAELDLSDLTKGDREAALQARMREQVREPFDLERGPLFKVALVKTGEREHALLLSLHHIICDGWSMGVLVRELGALYAAYLRRLPSPLPEPELQYADYALWQRQWLQKEVLARQLDYWRQRLAGIPAALVLPADHPRPAMTSFKGAKLALTLSKPLTERLRQRAQAEQATLYMVLLAAFQLLLSKLTGQSDIVVGSPVAGRTHRQMEGLIGFFVNTLVMRTQVRSQSSLKELLEQVKEVTMGAYAHQDLPFEKLVAELQPERDLSRHPLFQVSLTLQNLPAARTELPGLEVSSLANEQHVAKSDLLVHAFEGPEHVRLVFEYATDLFEAATIDRWMGYFERVLTLVASDTPCKVSEVSLLSAQELHSQLVDWNATATPYRSERRIHELIAEQARRTPMAVAVVDSETELTFAQLEHRANQLGKHLQDLGAGPEVIVGLFLPRSAQMVVALLAILKAGSVCLPLDDQLPPDRLAYLLQNSAAQAIITEAALRVLLPAELESRMVYVDEVLGHASAGKYPAAAPNAKVGPENLAYMIYTSGSTGEPKGVLVSHRGVCNLVEAHCRAFDIQPEDRFLQFTRLSFDVSLQEILVSLSSGATLHILDTAPSVAIGTELVRFLVERRITTVMLPSSVLPLLPLGGLPALRRLFVGGEMFDPALAREWAQSCRFINEYGTTETTVCSTYDEYVRGADSVTIGRPIANVRVYVLDGDLQPVPIGTAGELCIAGEGLARGYLHQPGLTAQRFVADPNGGPGQRMYRSGDRVRYRPDGKIEFVGRSDHQIKLYGHRIEPGEIEAALLEIPAMEQAVVVLHGEGEHKSLVAYLVGRHEPAPTAEQLRAELAERLPDYMIPAVFVSLRSMPLGASGKVDRSRLPPPTIVADMVYRPPRTPREEAMATIWADVLELERVGIDDNFFRIGGHSLLAARVVARMQESLHVDIPLWAFMKEATIRACARYAESNSPMSSAALEQELPEQGVLEQRFEEGVL